MLYSTFAPPPPPPLVSCHIICHTTSHRVSQVTYCVSRAPGGVPTHYTILHTRRCECDAINFRRHSRRLPATCQNTHINLTCPSLSVISKQGSLMREGEVRAVERMSQVVSVSFGVLLLFLLKTLVSQRFSWKVLVIIILTHYLLLKAKFIVLKTTISRA